MTQLITRGSSLFDEMDTVMQSVFSDVFAPEFQNQFKIGLDKSKYPKADIIDEDDKIIFEVDINRLKREDVIVEIQPSEERNVSHLVIQGGKQETSEKSDRTYLKKEIKKSSWNRAWTLSEIHYDVNNIKADVKDGLLVINVPKLKSNDKRSSKRLL